MSDPARPAASARMPASARAAGAAGTGGWGDPATVIAAALTAVWILGALAFWVFAPAQDGAAGGLSLPVLIVVLVLPVALIWVAAISARSARIIRQESARLAASVDAIRHTQAQQIQGQPGGPRPPVEAKLEEIARAQRQAEAAIARLAQNSAAAGPLPPLSAPRTPDHAPPPQQDGPGRATGSPGNREETADEEQPQLALDPAGSGDETPLSADDFIRALHFPEDERDGAGFRALRIALNHHFSAGLVRSAQDVLTLLAEDGIYMDDLAPDLARPEVWRRFAQGERGRGIAALGGVRDRSCLALTAGRMRHDPVFRDVAHHFLRKFDHTFASFEPRASDAEIVALSETRTARAFMLLGRVAGTFD